MGTRKALTFHSAGAHVRVVSRDITPELAAAAADSDRLIIERKSYDGTSDIQGAMVVVAATDSPAVNEAIATDARAMFRLASVVDAPEAGSFISMAVHRTGQLTVGVGTGSVPSAAARIRDAIADRFDGRYADAVTASAALRSEILGSKGSGGWAPLYRRLFSEDFCERVENGTFSEEIAACRS